MSNKIVPVESADVSISKRYALYGVFFATGFGLPRLYILAMIIYLLLFIFRADIRIKKSFLTLLALYSLFIFFTFTIGADNMTLGNPLKTMIMVLIQLFFLGYSFQYQTHEVKLNLLGFYLFGIFLISIITVVYSFITDSGLYGYGLLINPINNLEMNSPGASDALLLSFSYFYFLVFYKKAGFKLKILSIATVLLSFMGAIFLGGRSFFVLAGLLVIFYFLMNLRFKNIIWAFLIMSVLTATAIYILSINESMLTSLDFLFNRFSDQGLDSNRFQHYAHGLKMIGQYPFGGFEVDKSIEYTLWFHNIFLDTARVAGWLPLLFFITALVYTSKFILYKNKQKDLHFPIMIFSTIFILMQIGVVLEGSFNYVIMLFLVSYILIDSKVKPYKNTVIPKKIIPF